MRKGLDKFYTKPSVVNICYKAIKKYLKIKKKDLVIEPSAGNGVFISVIKKLSNNHLFIDIKPEHPDIKKHNFLTMKDIAEAHYIGNPPFGNKAATAIRFIKHAIASKAKSISFILPISFRKSSFQKSFERHYHLVYDKIMPENAFVYRNKDRNIRTVFQIWVRRPYMRSMPKKIEPASWYSFVKKPECNLAIRRVGFNVGKVKKCSLTDNENTNWFVKTDIGKLKMDELLAKLNAFKFDTSKNVGAYSISKQDIIKKYNKVKIIHNT